LIIFVCHIILAVKIKLSLCFSPKVKEKDWFINFHFIRASHGELPFERAEIVFGFQKSV